MVCQFIDNLTAMVPVTRWSPVRYDYVSMQLGIHSVIYRMQCVLPLLFFVTVIIIGVIASNSYSL